MKLKVFLVEFPHILAFQHLLQVFLKVHQLTIFPSVIWQDWNAVFQLEDVGVWCIVHQDHTAEVSIDYPKIFNKDFIINLDAILAI
jgi:hypothetical protein